MRHHPPGQSPAPRGPQPGSLRCRRVSLTLLLGVVGLGMLPWSGCKSTLDNLDVSNILGPAGRRAKQQAEEAQGGRQLAELEGHSEFEEAKSEFETHQYAEARKKLHKLVKKYKDKLAAEARK